MPSDPRETPAMQQYARFKKRYPGCVLLFRIGDFYEMFDDDAVQVSKAIGLTLTQRTAGVPMAGVPHHQLETYLRRLTARGFRVAVCEQLIDASAAKGIVPRAVTRVITPGTLVDESLLESDAAVCVGAVAIAAQRCLIAVADASTGDFLLTDCAPDALADELARRRVREVLYADDNTGKAPDAVARACAAIGAGPVARPGWHFRPAESLEALRGVFKVATLAGFGLRDDDALVGPAGALVRYLQETQTAGEEESREFAAQGLAVRRGTLAHLRPPRRDAAGAFLVIDTVSLRSLEVERTLREPVGAPQGAATDGTLLGVFALAGAGKGSARTPMGRRLLREWICRPLRDRAAIESRQAGVGLLKEDRALAQRLGEALAPIQDLARIGGRVALARATPRDLVALARSVVAARAVAAHVAGTPALSAVRTRLCAALDCIKDLPERIAAHVVDDPPPHLRDGGVIRDGVDERLDEARLLERDAGAWLSAYQARLIEEHKLQSLRVAYNKVAGYYIELPAAQARTAPPELKRTQTLRSAERFTTPELSDFERKVTTAQARALEREKELFGALCDAGIACVEPIGALADALAELDVLLAFADKSQSRGWTMPRIAEEPVLAIEQGRHPVLDETLGGQCVPNDCGLGGDSAALALITGPNMAGKSTYIRMVALLTILAHAGCCVPAASATVGVTDRVFTRIGADDALHAGQSTFMVEMVETANILHHAGGRSLVVLDEVGRGTSTLDGLSLAWAIVEHLAGAKEPPRTLFATHYHELTDLEERMPGRVRNLHVAVREWPAGDDHAQIVFLHRILPGRTDQSYGLHVARLAGIPRGVVDRAGAVLKSLAVHHAAGAEPEEKGKRRAETAAIPGRDDGQLALFTQFVPHPALDALREVKIEELTPLRAFDELRRLARLAAETNGR
ncbi:MAG TPA: DNA mismatch repair protein MutS [Phycisphaerales bacterium]|nr:DNA mismatch repair protein MutS [Phycisphaerales bacterium]